MTALALALATIFLGFQPDPTPQPSVSPGAAVVQESEQVAAAPAVVESAPTPIPGGEEAAVPTTADAPATSSPPSLPDVEFDDDEQRADTGGWPSTIYRCSDTVTDVAQLASQVGSQMSVDEVVARLEQNCVRL